MITAWVETEFGKVATLQRGYDLPYRSRRHGTVPVVTSTGITDTHSEAKEKAPGVVTGRYGTIGEVFFIEEDYWPHNTALFVTDFHGNDPLFVSYLLRTIDFQSHSGKSGVPGVNRNDLHALRVRVPPTVCEQLAIAEALGDADALLGALDRLIVKKHDIKQAAMQQLLTGQTHLPGFRGEWKVKTLHEVCQKIQDGTHFSPKPGGTDYLYVTSKNIRSGTLDISTAARITAAEHAKIYERCDVKKGDLLLTKDGANTGNAALNPLVEQFSLLSSVAMLRFDCYRYSSAFFLYQILSPKGQEQIKEMMSGNAITRLTLIKIRALRFEVPSFQEQTAIAAVLSDMDAEIATLEARRDKTRALKQAMMQELLTGRTRLI